MEGKTLEEFWKGGKAGSLSPQMQALAWGMHEAGIEPRDIAEHVTKVGGRHPSRQAVEQLLARIAADPEGWYPGKRPEASYGPVPVLRGAKRKQVAETAMRLKRQNVEPTYSNIIAACPAAARNPTTKKAVNKHAVAKVLKEDCFDDGAKEPWVCASTLSRSGLPPAEQNTRHAWAKKLLREGFDGSWFHGNAIWIDISSSIIPGDDKKAFLQTMARKSGKKWHSPDAKAYSRNLTPPKDALKQCGWSDSKVYWSPYLARGVLHVAVWDEDFPGETSEGAAIVAKQIPKVLERMLRSASRLPRVVMSDRGRGFFTSRGAITNKYADALKDARVRPFTGDDASEQPPNIPDLLLHEVATAWIRTREQQTKPAKPWLETREKFTQRMARIVRDINKTCDVDGLSRSFGNLLEQLVDRRGDKLLRANAR